MTHPAQFWNQLEQGIQCRLCPQACVIPVDEWGRCGVRKHSAGSLWAETYGLLSGLAMDPIEKKPLYHVLPGKQILSAGSSGCNLSCGFCQNWSISQAEPLLTPVSPEQLVQELLAQDACGLAYTYNEPIVNIEYVLACAQAVRASGRINVMVSNGYIQPEPLQALLPWIDAWNIDLKSIRPGFYRQFCGASLEPILETIRTVARFSHLELTHLVVTGGNDELEQISELVDWVAALSGEIPLHLSRYFPNYRWQEPPTNPEFLRAAQIIAQRRLHWVYLGNVAEADASLTCPDCQTRFVTRQGYRVSEVLIHNSHCPNCGRGIPGIFQ